MKSCDLRSAKQGRPPELFRFVGIADDGNRWGTLAAVADAYGDSVDTIRRRMKLGKLGTFRESKWLAIMPRSEKGDTERAEALVVLVRGDVAAQLHRNVLRQMT